MGLDGLKLLDLARQETGLPIITEVMSPADVDLVAQYTDILQIGARNMQNYNLLDAVGEVGKPVMVKRGMAAPYEEWLLAAEYVMAGGNTQVMLCERGIRGFEQFTRFTMDVAAIPAIKRLSHLPIIADPSHSTGKWYLVTPVALAAVAAGAHGLLIEVHPNPDQAKCDGAQSLTFDNFSSLMDPGQGRRRGPQGPGRGQLIRVRHPLFQLSVDDTAKARGNPLAFLLYAAACRRFHLPGTCVGLPFALAMT